MGHHPGFYAGLRSVFVCAGRSVGALSAGWLVAVSSSTYLPVFAFVVGVASLGLFVFMVAPPRLVGGSDLAGHPRRRGGGACGVNLWSVIIRLSSSYTWAALVGRVRGAPVAQNRAAECQKQGPRSAACTGYSLRSRGEHSPQYHSKTLPKPL